MASARVEVGRWDEAPRSGSGGAGETGEIAVLEAMAWLLDAALPVPGTRLRIGLDSALGLIPVLGDLAGMLLSSFILLRAARMGVPRVTLMRMGFNVALDTVLGAVPLAGDLFDVYWQANRRNVELLKAHARNPRRARRTDWLFAGLFLAGLAASAALAVWGGIALLRGLAAF
jgi:hypothetical protein